MKKTAFQAAGPSLTTARVVLQFVICVRQHNYASRHIRSTVGLHTEHAIEEMVQEGRPYDMWHGPSDLGAHLDHHDVRDNVR